MKYRKLRIAWSVVWGLLAVLLCVLWVRSYYWADGLTYGVTTFESFRGKVHYEGMTIVSATPGGVKNYIHDLPILSLTVIGLQIKPMPPGYDSENGYNVTPDSKSFAVSYGVLVSIAAIVSAIPWIRWSTRFSLRTLLIATTVIAVVLGIIVWMSRKS